jgi:hypothetical protein
MATKSNDKPEADKPDPLTTGPKSDDLKTEKEKGGKDPVGEAKSGEGVQILDIGVGDPYPHGKPPDPEEQFVAAHGFKRAKE